MAQPGAARLERTPMPQSELNLCSAPNLHLAPGSRVMAGADRKEPVRAGAPLPESDAQAVEWDVPARRVTMSKAAAALP